MSLYWQTTTTKTLLHRYTALLSEILQPLLHVEFHSLPQQIESLSPIPFQPRPSVLILQTFFFCQKWCGGRETREEKKETKGEHPSNFYLCNKMLLSSSGVKNSISRTLSSPPPSTRWQAQDEREIRLEKNPTPLSK